MVRMVADADEALEILLGCHQGPCTDPGRPPLRPRS
jgi:hypothetical protein